MGLIFYPRGGSAQVVRYLSLALESAGWQVDLASGSLGAAGEEANAGTFFSGLSVAAADYGPALSAYAAGQDPLEAEVPLHPSFEDGDNTPDRVFGAVSPQIGEHLIEAWARFLGEAWPDPNLFHLQHLTPLQAAVERRWPERPVITHLHGTELKMIDRIVQLTDISQALGTDLAGMADLAGAEAMPDPGGLSPEQRSLFEDTNWTRWRFGAHWAELLPALAKKSDRIIAISPHDRDEALRLLGVEENRIEIFPNGVDTERFDRRPVSRDERLSLWRRWLVTDPQGWDESGQPGSIRYEERDLETFTDPETGEPSPVLLYVGRFLDFKRVPLLVRAYGRARPRFNKPAPLVIWGGSPGEWGQEHPCTVARREGAEDIFFLGWRGHDELPDGLACSDALVVPSVNEPFGLVLLEAMSSGLPVIATRSGGPLTFVNTEPGRPNGWMIEPDDIDALADALVETVNNTDQRTERGDNAYEQIRSAYSWNVLAQRFIKTYEALER